MRTPRRGRARKTQPPLYPGALTPQSSRAPHVSCADSQVIGHTKAGCRPTPSEWQVKELVKVALPVIGERLPIHEATLPVERQRRFERRAASGFEAQAGQSPRLRLSHDVI